MNKRNDPIMQEILSELPPMTDKEFDRAYSLLRYSEKYRRIQERGKYDDRNAEIVKILFGSSDVSTIASSATSSINRLSG